MVQTIRRELRVAFSRNAQPIWFRVAKWAIFVLGLVYLWRVQRDRFWFWVVAAVAAGSALHGVWRWQTRGWTRPWGGWDDIETAQK